MKILWLSLCAGLFLVTAACRAQSSSASESETLLSVYVTADGDNILPRIVVGVEKPALTISTFEKVARIPVFNGQSPGIAAQLKPDDAKALAAAVKAVIDRGQTAPVPLALWFVSPDNKVLTCVSSRNNDPAGVVKSGVLSFYDASDGEFVRYLTGKLHPK